MKATIDRDGRIELKRELQIMLGVEPGDEVIVEGLGNEVVIRSAKSETGLALADNVLVHRGSSVGSIDSVLEQIRNERIEHLGEGLPR